MASLWIYTGQQCNVIFVVVNQWVIAWFAANVFGMIMSIWYMISQQNPDPWVGHGFADMFLLSKIARGRRRNSRIILGVGSTNVILWFYASFSQVNICSVLHWLLWQFYALKKSVLRRWTALSRFMPAIYINKCVIILSVNLCFILKKNWLCRVLYKLEEMYTLCLSPLQC